MSIVRCWANLILIRLAEYTVSILREKKDIYLVPGNHLFLDSRLLHMKKTRCPWRCEPCVLRDSVCCQVHTIMAIIMPMYRTEAHLHCVESGPCHFQESHFSVNHVG